MTSGPFSQRVATAKTWIHDDFPETARTALLHLLYDLIERRYVKGWIAIDKELRRIARTPPRTYDESKAATDQEARSSVRSELESLQWALVLDFCERLYGHLTVDVTEWNTFNNCDVTVLEREKVQLYVAQEVERILLEERLGFSFAQGEVQLRGRSQTRNQIARLEPTFADERLTEARKHFARALQYFRVKDNPDYENVIKEAVCAVEAAAKRLFPDAKGTTLGQLSKELSSGNPRRIPKALGDGLISIYALRSGGEGVSHGATDGERVTRALAEYVLATAASQIILLHTIEADDGDDIPF